MKIGIDARMYGSKQAGLGRYVEQLVLSLMGIDTQNEYVIFLNSSPYEGEVGGGLAFDETPPCPSPHRGGKFRKVFVNIPWYSWEEQVKLPKIIKKERIDLMHFPHWNVPIFYNGPFVLTIHDLIMYRYSRAEATTLGPVRYWFKDKIHRLVVKQAVKKAKHIFVTSEFTKQDVHQTLKVPMEKMTVTYQAPFGGISNFQFPISKQIQNSNFQKIKDKFKIFKPYVLYVGNAYPHKNLEGLLKAWGIFCEKYNCHPDPELVEGEGSLFQLVLVGKKNYFYNRLQTTDYRLQTTVIYTDYVSDDELSILYQNASLYVFPSLYEGFGLPPLEAMAYGVPVVSSNASCLPEVLGEAALYFDPENYEQIADVIHCGLSDENIRFELKQNAVENLKRFDWNFLAKQTLMCYNKHT